MGEDGIDKSGYNEASYKMERLDKSQRIISAVNQNLLAWYEEFGGYGYSIKKTELDNLISEIWGKMDDKTKAKLRQLRKLYDDSVEVKPIYTFGKVSSMGGEKGSKKLNEGNWEWVKNLLFELHMYINELLEEAGYSTFTIDTFDGDPYN